MRALPAFTLALTLLVLGACSAKNEEAPASAPAVTCPPSACALGARRCGDTGEPEVCAAASGCGAWQREAACEEEAACKEGTCVELSERQREHKKDLSGIVSRLGQTVGSFPELAVPADEILKRAIGTLAAREDDDAGYFAAARRALVEFQDGHLDLFSTTRCGSPELPELLTSRLGACTQPYRDHAVVAYANPSNALGLTPGDRIVEIDGRAGQAMLDHAFYHPFCGVGSSSESNRRYVSATSLLSAIRVGSTVVVERLDGARETKTVTKLEKPVLCRFPGAGDHAYPAKATLRGDGVAVVVVPTFLLPTSPALTEAQVAEAIGKELEKVKGAKGIVWDLRGNPGGATLIGLSIVGGMPGFEPGVLARCATRKPGSVPFEAKPGSAFPFRLTKNVGFETQGKVAVLIDGLTTSAGDFFALAASTMTRGEVKLFGAPTSGAFGGATAGFEFGKRLPLRVTGDEVRCTDAHDVALERRGVTPTTHVELEPADLAAGRDTVLEAAAASLR